MVPTPNERGTFSSHRNVGALSIAPPSTYVTPTFGIRIPTKGLAPQTTMRIPIFYIHSTVTEDPQRESRYCFGTHTSFLTPPPKHPLVDNETVVVFRAQVERAGLMHHFRSDEMSFALTRALEWGWLNVPILGNYILLAKCCIMTFRNFHFQGQNITKQAAATPGENSISNDAALKFGDRKRNLIPTAGELLLSGILHLTDDREVILMWGIIHSIYKYTVDLFEVACGFVLLLNYCELEHGCLNVPVDLLGGPLLKKKTRTGGPTSKINQHFEIRVFVMGLLLLGAHLIEDDEARKEPTRMNK